MPVVRVDLGQPPRWPAGDDDIKTTHLSVWLRVIRPLLKVDPNGGIDCRQAGCHADQLVVDLRDGWAIFMLSALQEAAALQPF